MAHYNLKKLIENKKNRIDECKKQVKTNSLKYNNLHNQNKEKLDTLNSTPKNLNKNKIKLLNNELKINREEKNELKIIIEKTIRK